ncbi:MAG: hypothetical protein K5931_08345 [Lachnospiraceae bacterium]|nr:hypothetical protein [Lachnospiraceae bacterium]
MKIRLLKIIGMIFVSAILINGCSTGDKAVDNSSDKKVESEEKTESEEETGAKEETDSKGESEPKGESGANEELKDATADEAYEACPRLFSVRPDAANISWQIEETEESEYPLVQLTFNLPEYGDDIAFTARARVSGDTVEDISGQDYEWTVNEENETLNWNGTDMKAVSKRYTGDDETVDLLTWYDEEIGINYSLLAKGKDLDGFDILAVAESMFPAEEEVDGPSDFLQEQAGVTEFKDYDEIISYLQPGQGYAILDVMGSDEKVLLVTDLVFEADKSAYDASVYIMTEGKPMQSSNVTGNGSSFPLRIDEEGIIYGGDNHNYETYVVSNVGSLMLKDYIYDGIETGTEEYGGYTRPGNDFDHDEEFKGGKEEFEELLQKREGLPIIEFTVIE